MERKRQLGEVRTGFEKVNAVWMLPPTTWCHPVLDAAPPPGAVMSSLNFTLPSTWGTLLGKAKAKASGL